MEHCRNCGQRVHPEDRFCESCGTNFTARGRNRESARPRGDSRGRGQQGTATRGDSRGRERQSAPPKAEARGRQSASGQQAGRERRGQRAPAQHGRADGQQTGNEHRHGDQQSTAEGIEEAISFAVSYPVRDGYGSLAIAMLLPLIGVTVFAGGFFIFAVMGIGLGYGHGIGSVILGLLVATVGSFLLGLLPLILLSGYCHRLARAAVLGSPTACGSVWLHLPF